MSSCPGERTTESCLTQKPGPRPTWRLCPALWMQFLQLNRESMVTPCGSTSGRFFFFEGPGEQVLGLHRRCVEVPLDQTLRSQPSVAEGLNGASSFLLLSRLNGLPEAGQQGIVLHEKVVVRGQRFFVEAVEASTKNHRCNRDRGRRS